MIIVCNGGYRTGSTLVYGICIEMAKQTGLEVVTGVKDHQLILDCLLSEEKETNIIHVFKSHNWLPPIASTALTIYTRRHYLDVYASFEKFKKHNKIDFDVIDNLIEENRRRKFMINRKALTLDYEDFYEHILWLVGTIHGFVNFGSSIDLSETARAFSRKRLGANPQSETIPWANEHLSPDPSPGNFIDVLDYETIKRVVNAMRHKDET